MKLRLRHKERTMPIEINNETTLKMLKLQAQNCYNVIGDVILSLNKRDPFEGDDQSMEDLGIVSGDLIYVTSICGEADDIGVGLNSKSGSLPSPAAVMVACCSAPSNVTRMETETGEVCCVEAVVNDNGDGDKITECGRPALDVSDPSASALRSGNVDSAADDESERVAEDVTTGVPCALSAEELQLVNRYLNEPMVVREASDGALPQSLVLAYSVICPQTPDAAVLVVIDVLMSELGYQRTMESDTPVDWDLAAGSTFLNYTYPPLPHVKFQLLSVRMLGLLIVHGLVRMSDDIIQKRSRLQLKTSEFVQTDADGSLSYRGGRLTQLSRTFKDVVAFPMLQFAMQDDDSLILPSLSSLFYELKVLVMKYLSAGSLVQLSAVNKDFHCIARQPLLWRRLHVKDFGRNIDMSIDQDWLSIYKEEYGKRKVRHTRHWEFPPAFPFASPYFPAYPPTYPCYSPPFMIGGDYDLRPNVPQDPLHLPEALLRQRLATPAVFQSTPEVEDQPPSVLPARPPPHGRLLGSPRVNTGLRLI